MNYEIRLKNKNIKLNHLRVFEVKYLSATNTKGSRIKINDLRHKKSITISYNYSLDGIKEIAINELLKKGIKINSFSYNEKNHNYYINTLDFETQIN